MAIKYYAIKQGNKPGIYTSWAECEAQVKGYKGAQYKSFNNEEDAKEFLGLTKNNEAISKEDKETIKWELEGIKEGLKERDIPFILNKVNTIAEILKIELEKDNINDYKK